MKLIVPFFGIIIALAGTANALPPAQLFAQRCAMCHQASGTGLPGQFPRLSGRVASIAQNPTGRHYLAHLLLNGKVGTNSVDGQPINGLMPSMAAQTDADIAAILTHVITLGPPAKGKKPAAFTSAEIAAVRKEGGLSATAVGGERAKLAAKGLLP